MGPVVTSGPVPLMTPQLCTHWSVVKCVQANACPFRFANLSCTSGFPSDNCFSQVPTRGPTTPTLMTNVTETINRAQEATPTLFQDIDQVVFHLDASAFSPSVLLRGDEWPALPARDNTAHVSPALTETATLDPAAPAAVGSGKIN